MHSKFEVVHGYKVAVLGLLIVYLYGKLKYTKYFITARIQFFLPALQVCAKHYKYVKLPTDLVITDSVPERRTFWALMLA